jgi:hypothetical protein
MGLPARPGDRRRAAPWPGRHRPGHPARSWKAQRWLHARYQHLLHAGKAAPEAATAVARELSGFVWAEMTA